jgi:hypothetical protein
VLRVVTAKWLCERAQSTLGEEETEALEGRKEER